MYNIYYTPLNVLTFETIDGSDPTVIRAHKSIMFTVTLYTPKVSSFSNICAFGGTLIFLFA